MAKLSETPLVAGDRSQREAPPTEGKVFRFYAPLALSWLFMAVESPIALAVVSRLPEPTLNTAAYFAVLSLSLWIESPVIDLLATSTTLARKRGDFEALTRFTLWLMALVTLVHATVALTPLYDLVAVSVLRLPEDVAASTRIGLAVMIPWSACIGWRRYLQGVLIRYGHTRRIGLGTAVRVATMALSSLALFQFSSIPGIAIVGVALIASVFAEAVFVHAVSRSVVRERFSSPLGEPLDSDSKLSMSKLRAFHLPLTATTIVTLAAFPITAAAIDRGADPTLSLAAWQLAIGVGFLFRTVVFALPEVVITLARDAASAAVLRRFCVRVGATSSLLLLALCVTGLDRAFLEGVLGAKPPASEWARLGILLTAGLPFVGALQSYVRGMLTAAHMTAARLWSVLLGVLLLVMALGVGLAAGLSGVVNAAQAMTVAALGELLVLWLHWRRRQFFGDASGGSTGSG